MVHSSYREPTYNLHYPNGQTYKYPYKYSYNRYPYEEDEKDKRKFPQPRFVLPWPFTLYTKHDTLSIF